MRNVIFFCIAFLSISISEAQVISSPVAPPLNQLKITSEFGRRKHPLSGRRSIHEGVDLHTRSDTVRSILNGVILSLAYEYGLGINIKIKHSGGIISVYGHLSQPFLLAGDSVSTGQPIGISGKTGLVTGEHLHFEIRFQGKALDPLNTLSIILSGYIKNQIVKHNDK